MSAFRSGQIVSAAFNRLRARGPLSWMILPLMLGSAFSAQGAQVGDQPLAQFAGLAITGDAGGENAAVTVLAPYLRGAEALPRNQRLLAAIHAASPKAITINTDGLSALDGSTSALAVAAAIDRETIVVEKVGEQYKLVVEIAAQALFFDFREKQVLASAPVTVQSIDVLDSMPDTQAQEMALQQLLDDAGPSGFVSNMAAAIAATRLPSASSRRMQLTEVAVSEGALDAYADLNHKVRSGLVGHEFSKYFAAGTGLALLPFRSGQAIGGAMAARFADGSVYTLTIPEADYVIRLRIDRVAQRAIDKTNALERRLYGTFFHLVVEEPLSGRRYLDQSLRQGATKLIPASQSQVDDAAAYYDTLLEGFASVAAASQGKADDWIAEQTGGRQSLTQWNELQELIDQCR